MENMSSEINLSEIILPLSRTMDIIDSRLKNHHRRVAYIASAVGKELKLDNHSFRDLVIASSLHDIGAVSEKSREGLVKFDLDDISDHAKIGSSVLKDFKPLRNV